MQQDAALKALSDGTAHVALLRDVVVANVGVAVMPQSVAHPLVEEFIGIVRGRTTISSR